MYNLIKYSRIARTEISTEIIYKNVSNRKIALQLQMLQEYPAQGINQ